MTYREISALVKQASDLCVQRNERPGGAIHRDATRAALAPQAGRLGDARELATQVIKGLTGVAP